MLGVIGMVDYGGKGALTVVIFYVFREFPLAWAGRAVSLFLLNMVFFQGLYIPVELVEHVLRCKPRVLPCWRCIW